MINAAFSCSGAWLGPQSKLTGSPIQLLPCASTIFKGSTQAQNKQLITFLYDYSINIHIPTSTFHFTAASQPCREDDTVNISFNAAGTFTRRKSWKNEDCSAAIQRAGNTDVYLKYKQHSNKVYAKTNGETKSYLKCHCSLKVVSDPCERRRWDRAGRTTTCTFYAAERERTE